MGGKGAWPTVTISICAKRKVTRGGVTASWEEVVAPKVGVTLGGHNLERKNETGNHGEFAEEIWARRSGLSGAPD
jgi:hypothetical protein